MKIVGIIGGFGPETTAKFFMRLVSNWPKDQDQRPEILLWNAPVNVINESELLLKNNADSFLPLLNDGALKMEKAGADFLVIPCNTPHVFINEIRESVKIPVLSIVDEVKKNTEDKENVGILATSLTLSNHLFAGNNLISPGPYDQNRLNLLIQRLAQSQDIENTAVFQSIVNGLSTKGVKKILLACTDLQLLIPIAGEILFIDSLEILAKATVENMLRP